MGHYVADVHFAVVYPLLLNDSKVLTAEVDEQNLNDRFVPRC